ncbi:hypothetical protein ABIA31_006303 [Catenulispora sp. MAP5-51]
MDMKLEVVVIPVADVERAKDFYTVWAGGWMRMSPRARISAWYR